MSCKANGGESNFKVELPEGYVTINYFPHLDENSWIDKFEEDSNRGLIRKELADKVIHTLDRLPTLEDDQQGIVSYSGGKDSQVIFMLAGMKYNDEQYFGLFADTHDEWTETYKAVDDFEKWMNVPIFHADSEGIHYLLREHIPCWMRKSMRHCTKNLKLLPQRDWMDSNSYGQDRKRGCPAFRNEEVGNGVKKYDPVHKTPIMFSGERWAESVSRSKLSFDERSKELLRWTHRPILDWTIEDVWEFIFYMQAPVNPVYFMGIKRVACAGCCFANVDELYLLGEHHPDMLKEWVITEEKIGVPRPFSKESFADIYTKLEEEGRLGIRNQPLTV